MAKEIAPNGDAAKHRLADEYGALRPRWLIYCYG
jgi:hypothetical protein